VDGEAVGSETVRLRRGDRVRIRATGRGVRGYLAVGGGIATGAFAGSASVDLRGRIGRPLRAGDLLGLATVPGGAPPTLSARVEPGDRTAPIRLVRGPQWTAEAERALEAGTFAVAAGDRTGIRLDGSDVPGGELLSEAPMMGAVQVTTGGSPIILLNDRLRLAGYHKPGVVVPADLGRVAQLRPGEAVRFQFVGEPARAWYRDL
jgi:allophanate hydrolase subunit 2